jgi:protein phosphatase
MRIEIPEFSLVALIGATSSGKTSFAEKHFLSDEILSNDFFRKMVTDSMNFQSTTAVAFDLLCNAAQARLNQMKTTVVDATNLQSTTRRRIVELARSQNVHSVAIVLNLPESILLERNASRSDCKCSPNIVKKHVNELRQSIKHLQKEGFQYVYILSSLEEIDNVEIIRTRLATNHTEQHGPFDIIGDIHGCFDELMALFNELGYRIDDNGVPYHPDGRTAIFLGDLCDRGPNSVDVLRTAMKMVRMNRALCVLGNHDIKLQKYLSGKNILIQDDLELTIAELSAETESFRNEVRYFLEKQISHYVLDDGRLVVSHAGIKEEYIGRDTLRVRNFCLYGETTGENDEHGLPIRLNWAGEYHGKSIVVYCHTPCIDTQTINNTFGIDTGCVFGGKLTALRYPEMLTVSIDAFGKYCVSPKLLSPR